MSTKVLSHLKQSSNSFAGESFNSALLLLSLVATLMQLTSQWLKIEKKNKAKYLDYLKKKFQNMSELVFKTENIVEHTILDQSNWMEMQTNEHVSYENIDVE